MNLLEQKIQTVKAKEAEGQLSFLENEPDSAGEPNDSAGEHFKQDSTTRLKQDYLKTQQQEVVAVLFSEIGIIEPVFSELINCNPDQVEGWLDYTENNPKIEDPAGFIITKLRNNEKPPEPKNGTFGRRTQEEFETGSQAHAEQLAAQTAAEIEKLRQAGVSEADVANWQTTLTILQGQTSTAQFSWLKQSSPIRRDNQDLIIGLKSKEGVQWVEGRLKDPIQRAAKPNGLTNLKFEVQTND